MSSVRRTCEIAWAVPPLEVEPPPPEQFLHGSFSLPASMRAIFWVFEANIRLRCCWPKWAVCWEFRTLRPAFFDLKQLNEIGEHNSSLGFVKTHIFDNVFPQFEIFALIIPFWATIALEIRRYWRGWFLDSERFTLSKLFDVASRGDCARSDSIRPFGGGATKFLDERLWRSGAAATMAAFNFEDLMAFFALHVDGH